ncbi:MAG: ATP-binding cassette domain-containing protein [Rhodobacteraceae bacterium]|nr:ATP-binding cassette domain-containing protein [Paracoccaceae bacterium]
MPPQPALLEVEGLSKHFDVRRGAFGTSHAKVRAVDDVSFQIHRGETLGLVGESGCGKSTIAKLIACLHRPTAGTVRLQGVPISRLTDRELRRYRSRVQMVFQDPYSSLNPRMTAGEIVGEPIREHGGLSARKRRKQVAELFQRVGLAPELATNYPDAFSGGQRQRIGLARALALRPQLIVADEPVSALDVSVQAQVINLMVRLKRETGVAYLFVSHDLAVVEHISDRVAVMYLGQLVELAPRRRIFGNPRHPYTEMLMQSVPTLDRRSRSKQLVVGEVPSPFDPPTGCRYRTRCPLAVPMCSSSTPILRQVAEGHQVACHVRAPGTAS